MSHRETLAALLDRESVRAMLGSSAEGATATRLEDLLLRCAQQLHADGVAPDARVHTFFVPGRIEVLGKHTDYAGGRSLLAAVDRGACLVAVPRQDGKIAIVDALGGEQALFALAGDLQPKPGWLSYPMTVARRVARNFPAPLRGAGIAFASDLPRAAGMSSSSVLIVAVFLALSAINQLPATETYRENIRRPEDLADYLAAVESGADFRALPGGLGVGTRGGSQDHTAILCARPGELVQYAFAPVRFERSVPLPPGYVFAVAVSGVTAEKTGSARQRYNRAAEQMRRAVAHWRESTGRKDATLGTVLDADPSAAERLRSILREATIRHGDSSGLLERVEQFIEESYTIIPAAGDALARGDLIAFGRLVDRSQQLAEVALRNQVPETVALARSARALGAAAASAFGAGFGGSVWALVEEARSREFLEHWRSGYTARFPAHSAAATFFTTRAGTTAVRLI